MSIALPINAAVGPMGKSVEVIEFSLILATLERTSELSTFLAHLGAQSYRNFELIVVDQNPDDRLLPVIERFREQFQIKHLRSKTGISRSRNLGLREARGNVIAFPDDDCWYAPDTLQRVAELLVEHPEWDGVTGNCRTPHGDVLFLDQAAGWIDKINVWRRALSITIFLRSSVVKRVGGFDEFLGVGSPSGFSSGEETDYLIRALEIGSQLYYQPNLGIHHVEIFQYCDEGFAQKGYNYGKGLGYVLRKHEYPLLYVGKCLVRSIGGIILSLTCLDSPKAKFHYSVLKGRLSGWLA